MRTGRRPGKPDTREAILSAARDAFAEYGYDRTSIRGIAHTAGVDPALVHHYFGSKDRLFRAAVESPVDLGALVTEALAGGDVAGLGERLVRVFLRIWDAPTGKAAAAMVRTMVGRERSSRLLREFLVSQVLRHVRAAGLISEPEHRFPLIASQMVGLGMARYILKIEPLASADPDWVAATISPTIQRYLTMELPPAARPPDPV